MNDDIYHTYPAGREQIVSADLLYLTVDLGFRLTNRIYVRLVGVDADRINGIPDDSVEARRGEAQFSFVRQWLTEAEDAYCGEDGYPLAIQTLRSREGDLERYEAAIYSRATERSLTDELLTEFPSISGL